MPERAFSAFMAITAAPSAARSCSGDSALPMLVDRGAIHNCVDPLLTPRLQDMMSDYCVLDVPQAIVAAGQHVLQGVATGAVQGSIIDDDGRENVFSFQAVVLPGMGANLFSVTEARWKGVSTIFHRHKASMEFDDIVLPINQLGTDEKTGKSMCSIKVELGRGPGGLPMRAESADLWHRRMGHINRKSMDVLRRMLGSGVDYNEDIHACDVCAVGMSKKQAHPKQATYDVQHAFQLVTVDLMGPIKPAAPGRYSYCLLYTSPSPRDKRQSRMPSSA